MTDVLERLKDHIESLLTGYKLRKHVYNDENDLTDNVVLFRIVGGSSNHLTATPQIKLSIIGQDAQRDANYLKALEISEYLSDNWCDGEIAGFRVLSGPSGPFTMSNGRHVFQLDIDAMVSR